MHVCVCVLQPLCMHQCVSAVCVCQCLGARVYMTLPFCLIGKCQQRPMCHYYVHMPVMIREKGNYHCRATELGSSLTFENNDLIKTP